MKNYSLTIGWLYPELMSTYGDRGNVIVLQKRCEWRGINVDVLRITPDTKLEDLKKVNLIFGGGAQDREQEIVMKDLHGQKGEMLKQLIENNIPALFVCGSPQLMGNSYESAEGEIIKGLGIFDIETKHPGLNKPRLIGNIVAEVCWENLQNKVIMESEKSPQPPLIKGEEEALSLLKRAKKGFPLFTKEGSGEILGRGESDDKIIVGFENHGGRTYLGKNARPLAKVVKGYGNNGEDGTEGVVYKNAIGCYFHGPLLPKNPKLADYLISKALEVKYKGKIKLEPLDDTLEEKAKNAILARLNIAL